MALRTIGGGGRKGTKRLSIAVSGARRKECALRLSELGLGWDRMKEKYPGYSGGLRQALTLLLAVLAKPSVLLLDEHTAPWTPRTGEGDALRNISPPLRTHRDDVPTTWAAPRLREQDVHDGPGRVHHGRRGEERAASPWTAWSPAYGALRKTIP
jgi:hypothetical protein